MSTYLWTCPYCDRNATIREDHDYISGNVSFEIKTAEGFRDLSWHFIVCPNPNCQMYALTVSIGEVDKGEMTGQGVNRKHINSWNLIPPSKAKLFPFYIPKAIRDDYTEACLIVDLSPKASATLARRCLQGIIRDFWKVKGGNLAEEIKQIKDKIDSLTWGAIKAVRKVGNIGAHMEKDINLIIDVEPKEAELLIGLIETLVKDWYIARKEKEERLKEIKKLAVAKNEARKTKKKKPIVSPT